MERYVTKQPPSPGE